MRYLLLTLPLCMLFLAGCKDVKKETKEEVREKLNHLHPKALEFGPGPDG